MPMAGPVFALDLALACGFCCGMPGDRRPDAGSVILKRPSEDRSVAFGNFIWFLNDRWSRLRPAVVVKERRITSHGEGRKTNDNAVAIHCGLHAIVEGLCVRHNIPFDRDRHDVTDSTWRKHYLGRGRWGSRDAAKAKAIRRGRALGFMSADCADDNIADAIGIWDWGCATFARRATRDLVLFEPEART